MGTMSDLAEAFRYPVAGQLEVLENRLATITDRGVHKHLSAFVGQIGELSLSQWEELHTRTLDLSPAVAPYVGFQVWGEGYQRGSFLAQMNRAINEAGIDPEGELADHLVPFLRFLDGARQPLPELLEVLKPAVRRMRAVLKKAEPANPYNHLFEAVLQAVEQLPTLKPTQPGQQRHTLQERAER